MRLFTLAALACYVAGVLKGTGWFVGQSAAIAVAFVAAGLAFGILSGVEIVPPRR